MDDTAGQDGPFRKFGKNHNAMCIVQPVQGVHGDMTKHLDSCPFNPTARTEPSLSQSRPSRCPRQIILSVKTVVHIQQVKSPQQIKEWQHDILRLFIAMEAKFHAASHPQVNDFLKEYFGRVNPSPWIISNQLIQEEDETLDMTMLQSIDGLQGTLILDSWSNKKRKHLAAAVILVEGKPYPIIVHDKSSVKKRPLCFHPTIR